MQTREVEIINKLGLHARAAAKLVKTAASYQAETTLVKDDQRVDAKSIMSVMMLAASKGTLLTVSTSGTDESQALEAICDLIGDRFEEEE